MTTPALHAETILRWFANRPLAVIAPELAALNDDHPVLVSADALADAADSDDEATRNAGLGALFGGLVEPLNDSFTPAGRAVYARIFGRIVWRVAARQPSLLATLAEFGITSEASLIARHARLRAGSCAATERVHPLPAVVRSVVVLSRVTIGADILISSLALQAAHDRWPAARIVLLGDGKLAGLFGGLPNVTVRPLTYARRGPLRERLAAWLGVVEAIRLEAPDVVFAPDSRLDQLGLLPICAEASYVLWENLQPSGQPARSLADRYASWLATALGEHRAESLTPRVQLNAKADPVRLHFSTVFGPAPLCAVKLDHGGNAAKSLPREAEVAILRRLREQGWRILLDRGFGADELANSDALLNAAGITAIDIDDSGKGLGLPVASLTSGQLADASVIRFHGSIAGWAAACATCRLAFSYDSVGHHLAAALGIPVVVAFTGYSDPAFPVAWQPRGRNTVTVVTILSAEKDRPEQWQRVIDVLTKA